MVGESAQELQLAGWLPVHELPFAVPGWVQTWFAFFPTAETLAAQASAVLLVVGSYVLSQYLLVSRPQKRGEMPATRASSPPTPALVSRGSAARPA